VQADALIVDLDGVAVSDDSRADDVGISAEAGKVRTVVVATNKTAMATYDSRDMELRY
jgi:hypothetical protein